jgi:hypothetical protein
MCLLIRSHECRVPKKVAWNRGKRLSASRYQATAPSSAKSSMSVITFVTSSEINSKKRPFPCKEVWAREHQFMSRGIHTVRSSCRPSRPTIWKFGSLERRLHDFSCHHRSTSPNCIVDCNNCVSSSARITHNSITDLNESDRLYQLFLFLK